ncbi:hypothetical protein [Secundilactobacillus collinoides]|uniref:Uncharacterized protein n=2 Tax=Secundilactobacillus collinoides TaxID=33960 RepID=A0A0R2BEL1_SECCO|nr:hypothetical protein [Secundilactobacillus collinoides]KRM74857.1 hypothetical protein FC82_GL002800 [Secundilactobacillus collinoides DSM 20515 = JCM 1123]KZL39356.1 hypothetical protein TY91_10130 [Secundilactobacillus collinoides]
MDLRGRFTVKLLLLISIIGLFGTFGSVKAKASKYGVDGSWVFRYRYEYKVRVRKPTAAFKMHMGKYAYQNEIAKPFVLQKGAVVRTWYSGHDGFNWYLSGGTHGKYDGSRHYGYGVNWTSPKSFKILKTYHGDNWF